MNKVKVLSILVGILMVLNAGLIFWFVLGSHSRPNHSPHHRKSPKNIVIQQLHFTPEQVGLYETAIDNHRKKINATDRQIRERKRELYALLKQEDSLKKKQLLGEVASLMIQIEDAHYTHFQEIKSICKPEQMEDFNELTEKLARLFAPPPRGKRRKP